jgi:hypothetical protein
MATITVREYNPSSGGLLGNVSVLSFGKITAGTKSAVKCIDIAFTDISSIGNLKLGLISSGGLTINSSPTDIAPDGSSSNGYFGIETTNAFDSSKASGALTRHFAGLNATITASDTNNVSIPTRSSGLSNFIYLDIQVDSSSTGAGSGAYKLFFDYN